MKKMTEKLFELAYTDSMTEVQNRNAYEKVVYITITEKTKDDMISQYNFTRKQRSIHFWNKMRC